MVLNNFAGCPSRLLIWKGILTILSPWSFYLADYLLQVVVIDVAITLEGSAVGCVPGHVADESWVLGHLVGVAHKGASGHVAGGNLVDGTKLIHARAGIAPIDLSGDACNLEDLLDHLVVLL